MGRYGSYRRGSSRRMWEARGGGRERDVKAGLYNELLELIEQDSYWFEWKVMETFDEEQYDREYEDDYFDYVSGGKSIDRWRDSVSNFYYDKVTEGISDVVKRLGNPTVAKEFEKLKRAVKAFRDASEKYVFKSDVEEGGDKVLVLYDTLERVVKRERKRL